MVAAVLERLAAKIIVHAKGELFLFKTGVCFAIHPTNRRRAPIPASHRFFLNKFLAIECNLLFLEKKFYYFSELKK
jgi:hypothetical protein